MAHSKDIGRMATLIILYHFQMVRKTEPKFIITKMVKLVLKYNIRMMCLMVLLIFTMTMVN